MLKFEVTGLEDLMRRFSEETVRGPLRKAMMKSVLTIEGNVRPLTPVGVSGRLRNSINGKVDENSYEIVGRVGSSLSPKEVYPAVMEFGRRAGAAPPPTEKLVRWVHLQLGVPVEEAWPVARRLAVKIGRRGIKEKRMFRDGMEKSKDKVMGYFEQAVKEMVE